MFSFFLLRKYKLVFIISFILFIIPFFWLNPGEMDLGGDSNRLYFYDPISSLKAYGIYSIAPYGVGKLAYNQYFIPFLLFLSFLKSFITSPTILIGIFNGLKLAGSFVFIFLIIKELFQKQDGEEMTLGKYTGAIIGALFYTFSPSVVDNMKYALDTHMLVFLNPMIFYLLLRYIITQSIRYAWVTILVTLIFSTSFPLNAPPVFAFYLLSIPFLFLYNFFILQKSISWKKASILILLFLGIHAYHTLPIISNVFDKGSQFNTRVFESTSNVNVGLDYFNSLLSRGKVSDHIFLPLENKKITWSLIFIPLLVTLGFLSVKRKNKTLLLVSVFFLITLFLTSANITQIGVEFYRKLFSIPGFGMFRNFYGQWQWIHSFFYALLISLAISSLFSKIKKKYVYLTFIIVVAFICFRSAIVFNGEIVNVFQRGSDSLKVAIRMDPHYEEMLSYIKQIPNEGRILHMPFTDFPYNIVGGVNRGVYIGQSMPALLAGKNDFPGYQTLDPFSRVFVKLVKEKNYPLIKQMMALLQIRYILYNSDEKVSNKFFPKFPYGFTGTPTSQPELQDFVRNISDNKVYEKGYYSLFEVDKKNYLPQFYAASDMFFYDTNPEYNVEYGRAMSFFPITPLEKDKDQRIAFIDRVVCGKILSKQICKQNNFSADIKDIQIIFQRINPTKYKLVVKNVTKPFILVFQNDFNSYWKLYQTQARINTKKVSDLYYNGSVTELQPVNQLIDSNPFETNSLQSVFDNTHFQVNGYANAWYIKPSTPQERDVKMIVEMTGQKIFYNCFVISLISLIIFVLLGIKLFLLDKVSGIIKSGTI